MATANFDVTQDLRPQVGSYLVRRLRPIALLLIAVPMLAGAAAAYTLAQQPARYQSTLRVVVPKELSSSASGIGLYLANLELRTRDPDVVVQVSKATGVTAGEYRGGIALARVGQSSSADFTFTSTDAETAAAVVETAASAGLRLLAVEGLPFAKREIELAQASYRDATKELNTFRRANDVAYPEEQYRRAVIELDLARASLAEAEATDDAVEAAQASATVDEMTATMSELERLLPEFEQLDDARRVALDLRSGARDRLARKQAEIRLTDPENVRQDITTAELPRTPRIVQGTVAAVVVAVFLLCSAFVLPDLLRPRHRRPPTR